MMKKVVQWSCLFLILGNLHVWAEALNSGRWKFVLRTTYAEVPFIIDFEYKDKKLTGTLQNGAESIILDDISLKDGKISIPLQSYEMSLELIPQNPKTLAGHLVRHNKNPIIKIPVVGQHGHKTRYDLNSKLPPTIQLTGKWSLEVTDEKDVKSPAIGKFTQEGKTVTGTIISPTGDYRYLEGFVSGNNFELASFDGVFNYVFRGQVKDGKMEASLLSNYQSRMTGVLNPEAELPDAYKQTEIKELKFIFPDLKGQSVNLNHPKFKNRPVVVQIFGSWCPNCIDEMKFLIPWYNQNHKRGVEIIALAFERSLSPEEATRQLLKVQKKLNVPYPILQAGSTSEDKPMDKLDGLKNFISFPTTIFLNRNHEVVKVHAGFSGPSTGEYFEKWKKEFNETINQLLKK